MGVYIDGLKMPKNVPLKIWLLQDGNARIQTNSGKLVHFKAVEVKEPHGDLIERVPTITKIQKIEEEPQYQHEGEDWINGLIQAEEVVRYAPTVIEGVK